MKTLISTKIINLGLGKLENHPKFGKYIKYFPFILTLLEIAIAFPGIGFGIDFVLLTLWGFFPNFMEKILWKLFWFVTGIILLICMLVYFIF